MKIPISLLLLIALGCSIAAAQLSPWPDAVVLYRQGANATPGFDSTNPYFPHNVLGRPDSTARGNAPASTPQELQALGTGGEIILRYTGRAIVNLPGPDFTVFENPFFIGGDSTSVFREVGIVSVSKDGSTFRQFPYSGSPTWRNLAGATPTLGGNPLDPRVSGGDKFDLAEINMDSVRYIRIVDAAGLVQDDGPSFDLDAVAALHLVSTTTSVDAAENTLPTALVLEQNYPNPFNPTTEIRFQIAEVSRQRRASPEAGGQKSVEDPTRREVGRVTLKVFDVLGKEVATLVNETMQPGTYSVRFDGSTLSSGVYYYRLEARPTDGQRLDSSSGQAGSFSATRKLVLSK